MTITETIFPQEFLLLTDFVDETSDSKMISFQLHWPGHSRQCRHHPARTKVHGLQRGGDLPEHDGRHPHSARYPRPLRPRLRGIQKRAAERRRRRIESSFSIITFLSNCLQNIVKSIVVVQNISHMLNK